jgi:hypothetical protein
MGVWLCVVVSVSIPMARLRVLGKYACKTKYSVSDLRCHMSVTRWGLMCLFRKSYN